ncbi:glycoside hydrolase family 2 TIM barrel-domain containing protein [Amphibacillus sediminis]|uniref:glycoside hydrolase family 2 TIM barrel-domain containing protein n=1 Tax=Amphibacillus sediminis TaxID=360185 RepID=UPI000836F2A6|nr:glycoside hydrolase family 2 TIM barrel-domain containing protein [Amphibacillus sediminis]
MNIGRFIQPLDFNWKFFKGEQPNAWLKGYNDKHWRNVTLPHDWSVEEPFSKEHSSGTGYLPGGTGWYRNNFTFPQERKNSRVYLTFNGVYNNAQVWCNSYYLGKRPYGYSTFSYDITDFVYDRQENTIAVRVDHKQTADSRWYTGSGIYRNVYVTVTNAIHIDQYGVFSKTIAADETRATIEVDVAYLNESSDQANIEIVNCIKDFSGDVHGQVSTLEEIEPGKRSKLSQTLTIEEPKLWSPDCPALYRLETLLIQDGVIIDCLHTTIGIRTFAFSAKEGFFLNGENIKMKGVCVHHDAGGLGAAVPKKVWQRRLKLLKEMGCNAIRMSHNPPDPPLLDLCDELGFLVIDEAFDEWEGVKNKWSKGHNVYPPKHYGYYEEFPQWGEIDLKDMVLRDRNHPSIVMWSIGNEIDYPNDPYCHPYFKTMTGNNDKNKPAEERKYDPTKPNAERLVKISKRLVGYVKEVDPTRPVTAALAFPELSNITGLADTLDVVGYNYKEHLYQQDHQQYPDRIIIGSENSAGLSSWLAVQENDFISSQFIWVGFDFLGEAHGWPIRASQAGLLDLAGFKKTGYYHRQSLWSSEPMVHVTVRPSDQSSDAPHWNWNDHQTLQVLCFTNCQTAELFVNGKSLGDKEVTRMGEYLIWDVKYEAGVILVKAIDQTGQVHLKELKTTSKPKTLLAQVDRNELVANGLDIAHIEIQAVDQAGHPVYQANNYVKLSVNGPAEVIGLENGDVQDLDPYFSKERKLYNGKLLAYIRSKQEVSSDIIITAEADGLEPVEISITSVNAGN